MTHSPADTDSQEPDRSMEGWRQTWFAVASASVAARQFKWALGVWVGSLAGWAILLWTEVDVLPSSANWLAIGLVGGGILLEFGLCAVVTLTAIEYLTWIRRAVG